MDDPVEDLLHTAWPLVLGAVAGAGLLTQFALWEHVRRTRTEAEFWGGFITIPLGLVSGAIVAGGLAVWVRRLQQEPAAGSPSSSTPLRDRWTAYLLSLLIFIVAMAAVYGVLKLALRL